MARLRLPDGGDLYYEEVGAGPPLLLVAGLSGSASFWDPLIEGFAAHHRVVLHDHRGTGRSSLARIDFSVDQMAGDVLALMDHLGVASARFVGHSTGGAIGQTLALRHPARLEALVLSGSWAGPDGYVGHLFRQRAELLRLGGPAAYLRAAVLVQRPPSWLSEHPQAGEIDEAEAGRQIPDPELVLRRIEAILRFDRRRDLPGLATPTLVIGARDDMVIPPHLSEELGRLIPGAETVVLPQGGHFFPQLHARRYQEVVLSFFERNRGA